MRLLKNPVFIVMVFVILATLFVPFGMGIWVKNNYPQLINDTRPVTNANIKLLQFNRGWFSSTAKVQISLQPSKMIAPVSFTVMQTIQNGPLIIYKKPTGAYGFTIDRTRIVSDINQDNINLKAITKFNLAGDSHTVITVKYINLKNHANQSSLVANQIHSEFTATRENTRRYGSLTAKTLEITNDSTSYSIDNLNINLNVHHGSHDFWLGERDVNIGELNTMILGKKLPLTIKGLTLNTYSRQQNNRINTQLEVTIKKLIFDNNTFGPNQLKLTVNQIDADSFANLRFSPQQANIAMFTHLVSKGMKIDLEKCKINTPWGLMSFTADINFQSQAYPSLFNILANMSAQAKIEIPQQLLKFALAADKQQNTTKKKKNNNTISPQQRINNWIATGKLIESGDNYVATLKYADHQLMLNGKPLLPTIEVKMNNKTFKIIAPPKPTGNHHAQTIKTQTPNPTQQQSH